MGTNICIVLGKIAKYVNIKNNKENELLLVRCFGRALNDKFTPCRNAALLSFSASIGLFTPNIIASKILPYIIKYSCDPFKTVRDSAFKCIEIGLQRLKQHALTLPDKPIETVANNSNNAGNAPKADASYLTSWASKITSGYSDSAKNTDSQRNSSSEQQHVVKNGNRDVSKEEEDEWKPKISKPSNKYKDDDDDIDAIF